MWNSQIKIILPGCSCSKEYLFEKQIPIEVQDVVYLERLSIKQYEAITVKKVKSLMFIKVLSLNLSVNTKYGMKKV